MLVNYRWISSSINQIISKEYDQEDVDDDAEEYIWTCAKLSDSILFTIEKQFFKIQTSKKRILGLENYLKILVRCEGEESTIVEKTYELFDNQDLNKPLIVLIHGYGGSGMIFYRIFKELQKHFRVVLMDLLGMGRSSRPRFN
jgi:predicted alpha/beta-fold hydrolase